MKIFFILFFILIINNIYTQPSSGHYPQPKYVGIETSKFDNVMTSQDNTYWCWAASAQIVLNYYGVDVSQKQIVEKMIGVDENGELPNVGATLNIIHKGLNFSDVDNSGSEYTVEAILGKGAPTASVLIEQLARKKPVIVGYETGNGGHIVVVTAVSYIESERGPKITSIIVRDPMPDSAFSMNNGKIEYPGKYLASRMNAYWFISVYKN